MFSFLSFEFLLIAGPAASTGEGGALSLKNRGKPAAWLRMRPGAGGDGHAELQLSAEAGPRQNKREGGRGLRKRYGGMEMLIFKRFVDKAQNGNGRLKGASNVG